MLVDRQTDRHGHHFASPTGGKVITTEPVRSGCSQADESGMNVVSLVAPQPPLAPASLCC